MKTSIPRFGAALFLFVGLTASANAQVQSSPEIQRGLRYGNLTPYDAEPITQRYSYNAGDFIYPFRNPNQQRYLDYLDKVDRAQKFGYPMPPEPVMEPTYPGMRGLFGFRGWRQR